MTTDTIEKLVQLAQESADDRDYRIVERVISVAKTWARDMADIEARGLPPRSWDVPLVEAVAAFDAINPDTSGAGEGDAKETP